MPHSDHLFAEFESDFKTLYEDAPLAYQTLSSDGTILLVNKMWLKLLDYELDEVLNRPLVDFFAPASQSLFTATFQELQSNGCSGSHNLELVAKGGQKVSVRIQGEAVRDAEGRFLRSHCVVLDMRAELQARKAQDQSEGRYQRLVELARGGIWEIDADAVTVFVNPAMATMLEYSAEEMVGKHLFEFMDDRGRKISERNLKRREQGIDEQHDFEFITKSGERIVTALETGPLFDDEGKYAGALAGVMNITERRRFEQEFQHTQKLESLGVLAGGIAHDFNNLLQAVVGNAELALTDLEDQPPARESLLEIQRAARRATDLCRQMLAYAGRTHFQLENVDLAELIGEMGEILQVGLSKKAHFEIDLAPDLPLLEADPSQLGQVVMNLITNASEALSGNEGTVRVTGRLSTLNDAEAKSQFPSGSLPAGSYVLFSVTDTGCGMDEETQNKIFDPFYTTKFAGRGLGLASVLGIVQGHGGSIAVDSALGKGSTFVVALPHLDLTSTGADTEAEASAGELSCLTVLIAEDEPSVARIVKRIMEHLGQKVIAAGNGQEAVDHFYKQGAQIDVVMLDLSMPIMDGKEAMQEIRALNAEVPIVICSGFPAEDIARGFGSDQPDHYLQKPFVAEQLRQVLIQCSG